MLKEGQLHYVPFLLSSMREKLKSNVTCPMKQFNVYVFSNSLFYLSKVIFSEAEIMAYIDFSFIPGLACCGSLINIIYADDDIA